jgi:hypothetical protein
MKYQVYSQQTNKVECEFDTRFEAVEYIESEGDWETHVISKFHECKGCEQESYERHDYYGISTGYWCDECYESSRYPYKKTRYATEEFDGYGERLSEDY